MNDKERELPIGADHRRRSKFDPNVLVIRMERNAGLSPKKRSIRIE